jgi:hypothetical protein
MIVDTVARERRTDPEEKKARCRLLAWLAVKCPKWAPEQINSEARVGSSIEQARARREDCQ